MEEQRIGRMYLNLLLRRLSAIWEAIFGAEFRSSRIFPFLLLALVLLIPAGIWFAHTHAGFHRIKESVDNNTQQIASPGPGGRAPVQLTATGANPNAPSFASATILPGLGMDVLQLTASLPGHGTVPLMTAPSLDDLSNGTVPHTGPDDLHGAIEVPWGGLLSGLKNVLGTSLMMEWQGTSISVPTDGKGTPYASEGGMVQSRSADNLAQPGPAEISGTFLGTDFDGHWPSKTTVTIQIALAATTLDISVSARNTGDEAEPMGIGWHPRFALTGERGNAQLALPSGEVLEIGDRNREMPTGRIVAAPATLAEFFGHAEPLRRAFLDDALVRLRGEPQVELRDPAAGYGLRLVGETSNLHELRVFAPSDNNYVSFGFQTNFDNPLGRAWSSDEPGVVVLQPGQSLEYKVRLEIFPVPRTGR